MLLGRRSEAEILEQYKAISNLGGLSLRLEMLASLDRILDKAGSYATLKEDKAISDGGSGSSSSQSGER